jgi:hypothetical protein
MYRQEALARTLHKKHNARRGASIGVLLPLSVAKLGLCGILGASFATKKEEGSMTRLLLAASLSCIIVVCGALALPMLVEFPAAVVCDRRGPNIDAELSSTRIGGYFEEHRIGPCVTYTHKSRPVPGGAHGGD